MSCSRRVIFPRLYEPVAPKKAKGLGVAAASHCSASTVSTTADSPRSVARPESFPEELKIDLSDISIPPFESKKPKLKSLLRRSKTYPLPKDRSSDLESLPSLVSISSESTSVSSVSFDPRIWVCEFSRQEAEFRTMWYSHLELERFKRIAVERVTQSIQLIPTGTGRLVNNQQQSSKRALFTNPALSLEGEDDDILVLAKMELANILVLDPHDICCKLYAKSLRRLLPFASITTCRSSQDAQQHLASRRFDMIFVEERLKHMGQESGSDFIAQITKNNSEMLVVGVSSYFEQDRAKLTENGADTCWPKPPPPMNFQLRNELLRLILQKRNKEELIRLHL